MAYERSTVPVLINPSIHVYDLAFKANPSIHVYDLAFKVTICAMAKHTTVQAKEFYAKTLQQLYV